MKLTSGEEVNTRLTLGSVLYDPMSSDSYVVVDIMYCISTRAWMVKYRTQNSTDCFIDYLGYVENYFKLQPED